MELLYTIMGLLSQLGMTSTLTGIFVAILVFSLVSAGALPLASPLPLFASNKPKVFRRRIELWSPNCFRADWH
jgi:hypothetical protein